VAQVFKLNVCGDALALSVKRAGLVVVLGPVLLLVVPGNADAQRIVKWVDAQGQVHYSDHAPAGQDAEAVAIHVAPGQPPPAVKPAASVAVRGSASAATAGGKDPAANAASEQQRRWEEQQEAAQAAKVQADKDIVDRCNRGRETYCDEGAEAIRQHERFRAEQQYNDAVTARQQRAQRGIPSPAPRPPPD
jgi:hypothetical protein